MGELPLWVQGIQQVAGMLAELLSAMRRSKTPSAPSEWLRGTNWLAPCPLWVGAAQTVLGYAFGILRLILGNPMTTAARPIVTADT